MLVLTSNKTRANSVTKFNFSIFTQGIAVFFLLLVPFTIVINAAVMYVHCAIATEEYEKFIMNARV